MRRREFEYGKGERIEHNDEYALHLPLAVFSRPEIPFQCKVEIGSRSAFPLSHIVICEFQDFLPAVGDHLENVVGKYETISLFFPDEADYLMSPHKIYPRKDYAPFPAEEASTLHRKFVKRFSYVSDIHSTVYRLPVSPIFQKMLGDCELKNEYNLADEELEKDYLVTEAKAKVRAVVGGSPVVRVNEKFEIIDGPF